MRRRKLNRRDKDGSGSATKSQGSAEGSSRGPNRRRRRPRSRPQEAGRGGRSGRERNNGQSVLVIGSGGREHALVWKFSQSSKVTKVYAIPGSSAIGRLAQCVDIKLTNIKELAQFASRNKVTLTVVGPEAPLAAGIVDEFNRRNLRVFGPTRKAAELEWSKVFSKRFMRRHSIPTASFKVFDNPNEAITFCRTATYPLVVKADGLAAGKGVVIVDDYQQAIESIDDFMVHKRFGSSGKRILVEELISGPEVSVMALSDGENCWLMLPAQDHKRLADGDTGPNTGGMGAYAPATFLSEATLAEIKERVLDACIAGMAKEDRPFTGVLYAGLMLTESGLKTLEFNCRFGDPEIQAILPLLESDLFEVLLKMANHRLPKKSKSKNRTKREEAKKQPEKEKTDERVGPLYLRDLQDQYEYPEEAPELEESTEVPDHNNSPLRWKSGSCASITLASEGYPVKPRIGKKIQGLQDYSQQNCVVFHAGSKKIQNSWVTAGGRVLNVTATGESLPEALKAAYSVVERISFAGMRYRRDIGHLASPSKPTEAVPSKD